MSISTSIHDFTIQKTLGRGSFGSVYLVLRKKDQKIYALKTVIFENLTKRDQENSLNEVRILASINHPNVIGYKEAFWDEKGSSLNIVMEYADDGDLESKIQKMRKEGGMFNESLIWSYSIQMIEGLKALHDKKIMHRDIKSANIFLVKDKHQCKIGDMNVSKVIKEKVLRTQTGTPYYASPEVWKDEPYSYKSDLWSIGCVIYELCALRPPFNGKDLDELYSNVCKGNLERISHIYSDDLWKMILMLLQVDVKKRVDCNEFLDSKLIMKKIPLAGDTVSQASSGVAVQSTLDVNVKVPEPPSQATSNSLSPEMTISAFTSGSGSGSGSGLSLPPQNAQRGRTSISAQNFLFIIGCFVFSVYGTSISSRNSSMVDCSTPMETRYFSTPLAKLSPSPTKLFQMKLAAPL